MNINHTQRDDGIFSHNKISNMLSLCPFGYIKKERDEIEREVEGEE